MIHSSSFQHSAHVLWEGDLCCRSADFHTTVCLRPLAWRRQASWIPNPPMAPAQAAFDRVQQCQERRHSCRRRHFPARAGQSQSADKSAHSKRCALAGLRHPELGAGSCQRVGICVNPVRCPAFRLSCGRHAKAWTPNTDLSSANFHGPRSSEAAPTMRQCLDSGFGLSDLFRISDFGFRIFSPVCPTRTGVCAHGTVHTLLFLC